MLVPEPKIYPPLELVFPEDRASIQINLYRIIDYLARGLMERSTATALMYGHAGLPDQPRQDAPARIRPSLASARSRSQSMTTTPIQATTPGAPGPDFRTWVHAPSPASSSPPTETKSPRPSRSSNPTRPSPSTTASAPACSAPRSTATSPPKNTTPPASAASAKNRTQGAGNRAHNGRAQGSGNRDQKALTYARQLTTMSS